MHKSKNVRTRTLIPGQDKQKPQKSKQNITKRRRRGREQVTYTTDAPEDQDESAGGGRLGESTELEGEEEERAHQWNGGRRDAKWGGGNPSRIQCVRFYHQDGTISRAPRKPSRQAPSHPVWRGKWESSRRWCAGPRRAEVWEEVGERCEQVNQTSRKCTEGCRMGLRTGWFGQPMSPEVVRLDEQCFYLDVLDRAF